MSDDKKYQPVPASEAKAVAEKYGKAMVVITSIDKNFDVVHTTTSGITGTDMEEANELGKRLNEAAGGFMPLATHFEKLPDQKMAGPSVSLSFKPELVTVTVTMTTEDYALAIREFPNPFGSTGAGLEHTPDQTMMVMRLALMVQFLNHGKKH